MRWGGGGGGEGGKNLSQQQKKATHFLVILHCLWLWEDLYTEVTGVEFAIKPGLDELKSMQIEGHKRQDEIHLPDT